MITITLSALICFIVYIEVIATLFAIAYQSIFCFIDFMIKKIKAKRKTNNN